MKRPSDFDILTLNVSTMQCFFINRENFTSTVWFKSVGCYMVAQSVLKRRNGERGLAFGFR